mmetsp:Transcript_45655/g.141118  ORF Transcript_45655/g.141118 Transcript_45655/m.141118 type:complete len:310 (+) Transcript_45655:435-1364(+)
MLRPPAQPPGPLHDDDGRVRGEVGPRGPDGALVEALQRQAVGAPHGRRRRACGPGGVEGVEEPRDVLQLLLGEHLLHARAGHPELRPLGTGLEVPEEVQGVLQVSVRTVGLVEQLDAVARVTVEGANPGHLLHGPYGQQLVPIGVKVHIPVAFIAACEGIPRLSTRSSMEVQQDLQASHPRIEEDIVNPFEIAHGRHDALQAPPTTGIYAVRRGGPRKVNQVPIAQGQAHNVETQVRHPPKVVRAHVKIQEVGHPVRSIRGLAHIAQTGAAEGLAQDLRRVLDVREEVAGAWQAQVLFGDETTAIVHAS